MPEDIRKSIPIFDILNAMNIFKMEDGFEADDLIGTLAKQAEKEGYQVYDDSDKDFGQLVVKIFLFISLAEAKSSEILGPRNL